MSDTTFLQQIAAVVLQDFSEKLTNTSIILPNKRAKVFLQEALKTQTTKTIFSPEILSIEEFIQSIAGIRSIDAIELLFEFYTVYLDLTPNHPESFETFANWAKTLLQDFNEIDRYLLEPHQILRYLENIKEIEHWSVSVEKRTDLIDNYLAFWKKLPLYYESLYQKLVQKGIGYQGLIYREAVANLNFFSETCKEKTVLFAGFNALNQAEERIVQHLLASQQARIYWDIDEVFLNDPFHDAGLFQRRFKSEWGFYKNNPYQWITNHFQQEKNIEVIGTPKSVGQAKIVGKILEDLASQRSDGLKKVAVVLGEETLLLPLLFSLPNSIDAINITMGFSSKNNPVQLLLAKLFKMHTAALARSTKEYVFYYKDILDVASHPLIESKIHAQNMITRIKQNNYTFIIQRKVLEFQENPNDLFLLLFEKWDGTPASILEKIAAILVFIKSSLHTDTNEDRIMGAFIFSVYKAINQLQSYVENYDTFQNIETLSAIYKQIIDLAEVSFEGEPLEGLQIMGVLESRVLDFETVIITSVNEGKFPGGKNSTSFIPYDVKKEKGLPTYKEKDAIFTYHFYHLLHRAKKVYLLYNTDSEGLDAGEKSRFITQLEIEKQPKHTLEFKWYNPEVPEIAHQLMIIPKSQAVLDRLHEMALQGFSPSTLTTYIRNPIQFYFEKILRIKEKEDVEETIAVNTLGTIIHAVLEELYKPLCDKILILEDIHQCLQKVNEEVVRQFKKVYKEGEIHKGRNLLSFEVAKQSVVNFLNLEKEAIMRGDEIQIIALEKQLKRTFSHPNLPFAVELGGNVDRIERRNGRLRIIDYKTGKVEKKTVTLKSWDGFVKDSKNDKMIQLLAYAFLYEPFCDGLEIEAGIISFKNLKSGFLPFSLKENNNSIVISPEILEQFKDALATLFQELFDKTIPFEEKIA